MFQTGQYCVQCGMKRAWGLGEPEAAQVLAGTRVGVRVEGKGWGQRGLGGRADESGGVTVWILAMREGQD